MVDWKAVHRAEHGQDIEWATFVGWAAEFGSSVAHRVTGQVDQRHPYTWTNITDPERVKRLLGEGWTPVPGDKGGWQKLGETRPAVRPRTACGRVFRVSHARGRGTLRLNPAGPEPACDRCQEIAGLSPSSIGNDE